MATCGGLDPGFFVSIAPGDSLVCWRFCSLPPVADGDFNQHEYELCH